MNNAYYEDVFLWLGMGIIASVVNFLYEKKDLTLRGLIEYIFISLFGVLALTIVLLDIVIKLLEKLREIKWKGIKWDNTIFKYPFKKK